MANRIRVIGLLLLLLVGVTSLMAMPDHEVYTTFYTDGTYATECGWRFVSCHGIYRDGCVTAYYVTEDGDPC
jgi:hypothetical protein